MALVAQPYDHYIAASHIRQWAIQNRVTVLRRGRKPKQLDVGKAIAAERGLNSPKIESAYGKVENAFTRALPRLIGISTTPRDQDWQALRNYAVLMHDRYPRLRGSATDVNALPGGNAVIAPNPDHWGRVDTGALGHLATTMDREQLKAARLLLLPASAQSLPRMMQVFHVGPMLLGDAGIHAITMQPDETTARTFVAMPLTPGTMVVFGNQLVEDAEVPALARSLTMKIAMESTVVVDTIDAPIFNMLVAEMWSHQLEPSGEGLPKAIRVWSRIEDIPNPPASAPGGPDPKKGPPTGK